VAGARTKNRAALQCEPGKTGLNMMDIDERHTAHKADKRTARTAICSTCGDRFARGQYSNQHKSSRGEIVPTSKYCSSACRQAAYRTRRDIRNNIPVSARPPRPVRRKLRPLFACVTNTPKDPMGTTPHASVTRAEIPPQNQLAVTPQKKSLPREIVPDAKWPGMYHLRLLDGSLSDMVNLTRAKDALAEMQGAS
jgi:hypothetical protein